MTLYWNRELFKIGIEIIDHQHEQLFKALDTLHESSNNGTAQSETGKILDFLEYYASTHFTEEERLMANCNYPGLERQKQEHAEFLANLTQYKASYEKEGPQFKLFLTIYNNLNDWLVDHISTLDREMGLYVQKNSSNPKPY